MVHHVEVFQDYTPPFDWGWHCYTSGCEQTQAGFDTAEAADEAADEHRKETAQ